MISKTGSRTNRVHKLLATVFAGAACLAVAFPGASPAQAAKCPSSISPAKFMSQMQLKKNVAAFNRFGPRILGSNAQDKAINWLGRQARQLGMRTHSTWYRTWVWLPRARFRKGPGLNIAAAGDLTVHQPGGKKVVINDGGAVHWSQATGSKGNRGKLVYLPPDEEITAANSAGKVVIRDFEPGNIPFGALKAVLAIDVSPDLDDYDVYTRPYLTENLTADSLAASAAGAAGVIFAFDLPQSQISGYYDPHVGTIYRQPELFVGRSQGNRLKALAAQGASATVGVRARIFRKKTRNLIARLPGMSKEKIVLAANTDGNSHVQENGVIGMLAFARYYSNLPKSCRPRTLELVFSTAHDSYRNDGLLPRNYPVTKNTVLAFAIEHLGTRELEPTGEGAARRLKFTGNGEPLTFAAGESDLLRETAISMSHRWNLDHTVVLKGLGLPNPASAPTICSMGGLGTLFHIQLVPTLAMITGPWSLYAPSFGMSAINFGRMREEIMAAGDSILALDDKPRAEIAGNYPNLRAEIEAGTRTPCIPDSGPQFAPGPA